MHMSDALLSPAVGLAMDAISLAAVGISVAKVNKDEFSEKKIPIMGVAGAMVFAAQMINFTIPATGSSGHIGGGIMLAGLLGNVPAFLSITAVLIIQCLFFADGGLLALGANIFNIVVIPCRIVYPLIFRPLLASRRRLPGAAERIGYRRLSVASITSAMIALELGALCVVIQTTLSGITALPFGAFAALMLPIHLVIGLVEGVVTSMVLCFILRMRPEIIISAQSGKRLSGVSTKKAVIALAALTIIVGGALSLFSSANPDGLEWAVGRTASTATGGDIARGAGTTGAAEAAGGAGASADAASNSVIAAAGDSAQNSIDDKPVTAILPGYAYKSDPDNTTGTSVSGVVGAAVTFALAGTAGLVISIVKRNKKAEKNV